jgi:thiol-disulfide isomerase/thioredoxin
MTTGAKLIISFLFTGQLALAQSVSAVYKINELLERIDSEKGTVVVNFWATWCKPCIAELPAFDSLNASGKKIKVLLVSLDFKEDLNSKVNPFLKKRAIKSECLLLDEVNGNDFINKISKDWSGAIPGTLIKKGNKKKFIERKLTLVQLEKELEGL